MCYRDTCTGYGDISPTRPLLGHSTQKGTYNIGTQLFSSDHLAALAHLLSLPQRLVVKLVNHTGTLLPAGIANPVAAQPIPLFAYHVGGAVLVRLHARPEGAGEPRTHACDGTVKRGATTGVVVAENEAVGAGEGGGTVLCIEAVMKVIGT